MTPPVVCLATAPGAAVVDVVGMSYGLIVTALRIARCSLLFSILALALSVLAVYLAASAHEGRDRPTC